MPILVGFDRIKENTKEEKIIICEILVKILTKIIDKPQDVEPRRLLLESPDVSENLMPFNGGLEVLFEMGFVEVTKFQIMIQFLERKL